MNNFSINYLNFSTFLKLIIDNSKQKIYLKKEYKENPFFNKKKISERNFKILRIIPKFKMKRKF